tara:strand:- start:9619 stop:10368 length:750 start_codon:yes stop_codon:yes gene_type:complete
MNKIICHIDMSKSKLDLKSRIDKVWGKYVAYHIHNVPQQDYKVLYDKLSEYLGYVDERISVNGSPEVSKSRDIKYNPELYHYFASNTRQPLHTDYAYYEELNTPDWLMLYCMDVSEFGGMTHLLSVKTLKNILKKYNPDLLKKIEIDINWKYTGKGKDIIHTRSLFDGEKINWNYWQIKEELNTPEVMNIRQEFFDFMENIIEAGSIYDFSKKWKKGDCIIFNDHHCLHGRDAFLGNNRWLKDLAFKKK